MYFCVIILFICKVGEIRVILRLVVQLYCLCEAVILYSFPNSSEGTNITDQKSRMAKAILLFWSECS